jgi:hypothetical protein
MTITAKLRTTGSHPEPTQNPGSKTYKAIADAVGTLRRYDDVPVRLQRQWITAFLAIMIVVSIVAGLYLNVSSRAAIAGREIQSMQRAITANQFVNADLQTKIATLLSSDSLQQRAVAAGYVPLQGTDVDYIVVPGYFPNPGAVLVTPPAETKDIRLSPDFSESLSSWFANQLELASMPLAQEH